MQVGTQCAETYTKAVQTNYISLSSNIYCTARRPFSRYDMQSVYPLK